MKKPSRRLIIGALLAALALSPLLFFEWHDIDGVSMWPAFADGDQMLVRRGDDRPERFAAVIVRAPGARGRTVLKRAVAFEGERVVIVDGDLLVNGVRPERSLERMLEQSQPLYGLGSFRYRQRAGGRVLEDTLGREAIRTLSGVAALSDEGTHLRLAATEGGTGARIRCPVGSFRDDHPGPGGTWVEGEEVVQDLIVTLALGDLDAAGTLSLRHRVNGEVVARLEIRRRGAALRVGVSGGDGDVREIERIAPLASELRWILVDRRRALQLREPAGDFETLDSARRDPPVGATESWLEIELEGSAATLARLDIDRDIHYTSSQTEGVHGVTAPFRVPAGQLFILGDNSPESRDSRHWGAIEIVDDLVGRPFAVVWPRERAGFSR